MLRLYLAHAAVFVLATLVALGARRYTDSADPDRATNRPFYVSAQLRAIGEFRELNLPASYDWRVGEDEEAVLLLMTHMREFARLQQSDGNNRHVVLLASEFGVNVRLMYHAATHTFMMNPKITNTTARTKWTLCASDTGPSVHHMDIDVAFFEYAPTSASATNWVARTAHFSAQDAFYVQCANRMFDGT